MDLTNQPTNQPTNQCSWDFDLAYTVSLSLGNKWYFNKPSLSWLVYLSSHSDFFYALEWNLFFSPKAWGILSQVILCTAVACAVLSSAVSSRFLLTWKNTTAFGKLVLHRYCAGFLVSSNSLLIVLAFPWKWSYHLQIIPISRLSFQL